MNLTPAEAELITLWKHGAEIEQRCISNSGHFYWEPFNQDWAKTGNWEYQVKSAEKSDVVRRYCVVNHVIQNPEHWQKFDFTITTDGETGELKRVRKAGSPCPERMEAYLKEFCADDNLHFLYGEIDEALRTD